MLPSDQMPLHNGKRPLPNLRKAIISFVFIFLLTLEPSVNLVSIRAPIWIIKNQLQLTPLACNWAFMCLDDLRACMV